MKVLIADKLSASAINKLESLGCVVISNPELSAESLVEAISDFEVLVVRSTKVSAAVIDASTALSLPNSGVCTFQPTRAHIATR